MNVHKPFDMLETRLQETGYAALFLLGEASAFWQNGAHQRQLEEIAYSEQAPPKARFLAAEILRTNGISPQPRLAQLYALALRHSAEEQTDHWQINANSWAELFDDTDTGPLGNQLTAFGTAAIPHLQPLLNDNNVVLYDGSEEATLGNAGRYRVKDFAAWFISKIMNIPFHLPHTHAERDLAIDQLKTSI